MNLTIFKYSLRRGFFSPVSLVANCGLPLFILIFGMDFEMGDYGHSRGYFLLAMVLMFGAFFMARGIQNDKIDGVVIRVLAGPVTMFNYLVQNFFAAMVPMVGLCAIIGVLGVMLHGWGIPFAVGLAICYSFLAATSIGLSFVFSCWFKDKEVSTSVFTVVITFVAFLGGFTFPLSLLPAPLFYAGALFPAHWTSLAIENLLDYGFSARMYWLSLLAMFLFAVAYILYGGKRRII